MSRGRKREWSDAQVAAVQTEGLKGTSGRKIRELIETGQLHGYTGPPMPLGTIHYHVSTARRRALESQREPGDLAAIIARADSILAGLAKDAEVAYSKMRRELRAGKPEGWDTALRVVKLCDAMKRAARATDNGKPGQAEPPNPHKGHGDSKPRGDLLDQLAATETTRQPG